jgi:type IV pilus assembly protein PilB
MMPVLRLGEFLISQKKITQHQLEEALKFQAHKKMLLGKALIKLKFITEEDIALALSQQFGIEIISIDDVEVDEDLIKQVPISLIRNNKFLPYRVDREKATISVLVDDPLNIVLEDDIKNTLKLEPIYIIIKENELDRLIERHYGTQKSTDGLELIEHQEEQIENFNLDDMTDNSPVLDALQNIFKEALMDGASDIHLGLNEDVVVVRFRVDGILYRNRTLPKNSHQALIAALKIKSGADVTSRRSSQDGRMQVEINNKFVDMRVNFTPLISGEKATIRILDKQNLILSINDLGFHKDQIDRFKDLIRYPYGLILVTGPTGSGKSSTMHTVLDELNDETKHIITIEDPVEYRLEDVSQIQVNAKLGITFSEALRSALRQDPDIIMVGEIRDTETADTALRASGTGHLVLATLHTNSAVSSITRLLDMGIPAYLVAGTVMGVVNQRLIRKICEKCKVHYDSADDTADRSFFGIQSGVSTRLYKGTGCSHCRQTGFKGRLPIQELLVMNDELRRAVMDGKSVADIESVAVKSSMRTLKEDGLEKALAGLTTLEEVRRFVI